MKKAVEDDIPTDLIKIKEEDENIMLKICENLDYMEIAQKFSKYLIERSTEYGNKLKDLKGEIYKISTALKFQEEDLKKEKEKYEKLCNEMGPIRNEFEKIDTELKKVREEKENIQSEIKELNSQLYSEALILTKEELAGQEIIKNQLEELRINKMQAYEEMINMKKKFFEWLSLNAISSESPKAKIYHTVKMNKAKKMKKEKRNIKRLTFDSNDINNSDGLNNIKNISKNENENENDNHINIENNNQNNNQNKMN